jgi:transposase
MKKNKGAKTKTKSQGSKPIHEPNLDAGGIDLSPTEIWVAVPPERAQNSVRKFATFTKDLIELVQWWVPCGVDMVAMEATRVYWIPLYQLLEDAKIKVRLVNARHVKNVAMAHQMARIIWTLITRQVPFDLSLFAYEQKLNEQRRLKRLQSSARQMGYQLTPIAAWK